MATVCLKGCLPICEIAQYFKILIILSLLLPNYNENKLEIPPNPPSECWHFPRNLAILEKNKSPTQIGFFLYDDIYAICENNL